MPNDLPYIDLRDLDLKETYHQFSILLDDEEGQLLLVALDQMCSSDEASAEKCAALHRKISERIESLDKPEREVRR